MEKKFKLLPPAMPNFITVDRPAVQRQEGINGHFQIAVSELNEAEADEYATLMKWDFMAHWKKMVDAKNQPAPPRTYSDK